MSAVTEQIKFAPIRIDEGGPIPEGISYTEVRGILCVYLRQGRRVMKAYFYPGEQPANMSLWSWDEARDRHSYPSSFPLGGRIAEREFRELKDGMGVDEMLVPVEY